MSLKDLGEIHQHAGGAGLRRILESAPLIDDEAPEPAATWKLPPMVDITEFLSTPMEKPKELIHGLLHRGSKMVIGGSSKSRKTWNMTHLALCVATGKPWWGLNTTRGRVLYANFEIDDAHFQERVASIKEKMMLEAKHLKGQMTVWNLRGFAADISDLVAEVIDRTKDKFDLVILDPIYKVLGDRDENSNGDVADLMNEIDRIIVATGAAVVFGHHFSKGNQSKKDAMDRMSGAGAFARDVDALLMLTKHEMADTLTVEAITRNHKQLEPFCVVVDHPIMERAETLDPSKLKQVHGAEKKYFVVDLLKTIGVQQLIRAELERQYRENTGAGEGTFDKLFKEAKTNGQIELCEDGKKWKAVNPIYPPGYNAHTHRENSATVQE